MYRSHLELYPDFSAEVEAIDKELTANGISVSLLQKIINKHLPNMKYNKKLYNRYRAIENGIPIFARKSRFEEANPINNKINNDFFSEIVDFKTGYFAGEPITYGYSKTNESQCSTGGYENLKIASKIISDFTVLNNMYGVDMEITRLASIYGYSGRLFYIDLDGHERVMQVPGFETIILSNTNISEPQYAIRYFYTEDLNRKKYWSVEFYDSYRIHTYKGDLGNLVYQNSKLHMFDYCPLQAIANNKELMGDAEKVLSLIDDYDKVLSDNSNEVEAFVHAYLVFENMRIDEETIHKGQQTGAFMLPSTGTQQGKAYFLTKNINDTFTEHHLERLQNNIYRFSKTPNLNDNQFNNASGVSLKFKLHGLETKCGMFEAKMLDAAQYMWKLLCNCWSKKGILVDPLQITMDFNRNFPLDLQSEAQAVQVLISAGLPKEVAYSQLSFIDDVDYVMQMIEHEQNSILPLSADIDLNKTDNEIIK